MEARNGESVNGVAAAGSSLSTFIAWRTRSKSTGKNIGSPQAFASHLPEALTSNSPPRFKDVLPPAPCVRVRSRPTLAERSFSCSSSSSNLLLCQRLPSVLTQLQPLRGLKSTSACKEALPPFTRNLAPCPVTPDGKITFSQLGSQGGGLLRIGFVPQTAYLVFSA